MSKDDVIDNYNYYVGIIFELFKRIIAANQQDNIQHIFVNNNRVISWKIWDYELVDDDKMFGFSINLLADGTLVCVNRSGIHRKDKPTNLSFVDGPSGMFFVQVDCIYCTLSDIYNAIYLCRNDFGINFESDWPVKATDFYINHL